jgi:hypothetical protein
MKTILISGLTVALAIACSSLPPSATESSNRQTTVSPISTVNSSKKTLVSESATQRVSQAPIFKDYSATENFSGTPAPVNLASHPQARTFRTVLQQGAKQGPNFAGKYTLLTWGCGTSCQMVGIINAETGSVYMLDSPAEAGVKFQLDSRLLIVNPPENLFENKPDWLQTRYYVWDGTKLTQVSASTSETPTSSENPTVATVKRMVNGDLICYVTLVDENNIEHQVGATFEICENPNRFLNQKVRLFYKRVPVNDCESAEPCGKTRSEPLITNMEIVGGGNSGNSGNSQILSNG